MMKCTFYSTPLSLEICLFFCLRIKHSLSIFKTTSLCLSFFMNICTCQNLLTPSLLFPDLLAFMGDIKKRQASQCLLLSVIMTFLPCLLVKNDLCLFTFRFAPPSTPQEINVDVIEKQLKDKV